MLLFGCWRCAKREEMVRSAPRESMVTVTSSSTCSSERERFTSQKAFF